MNKIYAVIGANLGDEGKGRTVAELVKDWEPRDSIVIRYNSSAQASHTVYYQGKRHAYSHFSCGTPFGIPTYLSRFFVLNPILFMNEANILREKGIWIPQVWADQDCLVITPYDMFLAQALHKKRGDNRTCGTGMAEAIVRSTEYIDPTTGVNPTNIQLKELGSKPGIWKKLDKAESYYRTALLHHEVEPLLSEDKMMKIVQNWVRDAMLMYHFVWPEINLQNKDICFEGAQGLLLDQNDINMWPYITRSNTGLRNIETICNEWNLDVINSDSKAYYVTRPYLTRHGSGPLNGEDPGYVNSTFNIVDKTNVPNPFQGSMRYGILNTDDLETRIKNDSWNGLFGVNIAVSCFDQFRDFKHAEEWKYRFVKRLKVGGYIDSIMFHDREEVLHGIAS